MERDGVIHASAGAAYGPPWMCADEYLASLRDIPDYILDAAPEDVPEEVWSAAMEAEAARMPDPLADAPGVAAATNVRPHGPRPGRCGRSRN